jgi:hypothetical protein
VGDGADESGASSSASGSGDEAGCPAGAPTGLDWASGDVRERIRALVQQKGAARPPPRQPPCSAGALIQAPLVSSGRAPSRVTRAARPARAIPAFIHALM